MVLQATIESGGTFTREYRVGGLFALGLKGTLQPYEIDIETKEQNAPDSAYTRIQPLQDFSTITISDTLAHTFQTNQVEEVVRLTVTNNSSGRMTLHGSPVDTIDEYFVQDGRRWLYAEKQDTNSVTIGSNQYDVAEDGSGDLVIRDDAGNDVLIWDQSAGQWDFKSQVVANLGELSTDEADITGETFITAERNNGVSSVSSSNWTNIADTENEDVRDEQDASFNINVDETGYYDIIGQVRFFSITDGDGLIVYVRSPSGTDPDNNRVQKTAAGTDDQVLFSLVVKLQSGTNYRIQARDLDSTYSIGGNPGRNFYTVKRSVVHP